MPDRWGLCSTIFDDLPDPGEEPLGYQNGPEVVGDASGQISDDDATREGCRRVRESYQDSVTGAVGYRFGVTCVETFVSPPN